MSFLSWILAFAALTLALAWKPVRARTSLIFAGALLAYLGIAANIPDEARALIWLLLIAGVATYALDAFRREHLIRPLMLLWQRRLRSLPAIEALPSAWAAELLNGHPNWRLLLALKRPEPSAPPKTHLAEAVRVDLEQIRLSTLACEALNDDPSGVASRQIANSLQAYLLGVLEFGENPELGAALARGLTHRLLSQQLGSAVLGQTQAPEPEPLAAIAAIQPSSTSSFELMLRAHSLLAKAQSASPDDERCEALVAAQLGRIYHLAARSFGYAMSGNRLAPAPASSHRQHYQMLTRYSANLALLLDLCLLSQRDTSRFGTELAEALSWLYAASIALKAADEGDNLDIKAICERSAGAIEGALHRAIRALPFGLMRLKARILIFPLGRRY